MFSFKFDKIDGFIKDYDRIMYLVKFGSEKYDFIYNRIRYLLSAKVVLHMLFLITMPKSKYVYTILYL